MTGQVDAYYGGSRDGQRHPLDGNLAADRVVDPTGGVYVRHPDFDTDTDRAWFALPSSRPDARNGVHVEPQPGQAFIVLADLRTLLNAAECMGHTPDSVVYARAAFKGQALTLGIKAAPPTPPR